MSITPKGVTMPKFGKYKIVVCGTRTWGMEFKPDELPKIIEEDYLFFVEQMDFYLKNLPREMIEIVSGCAPGPDTMAIRYAEERNYKIWRFAISKKDWKCHGKKAGIIRNTLMADFSTHCIAFWDGKSHGTADMIKQAREYELAVRIIHI